MSQEIEVVKKLHRAFETKDAAAFRALLHEKYTFRGPMMEINGPEEAEQMLAHCPAKGKNENLQFYVAGDHVIQTFDWVIGEPVPSTIRMCSVITLRDGKVFAEELFYDSARFPQEILESMKAAV